MADACLGIDATPDQTSLAALIALQQIAGRLQEPMSRRDAQAVLQEVIDGVAGVIPASDHAVIASRASGLGLDARWICRAETGPGDNRLHLAPALLPVAAPVVVGDARLDERADRIACRGRGICSLLVVPVGSQRTGCAVLECASSRPFAFSDKDVALAQLLAGMLAGVLAAILEGAPGGPDVPGMALLHDSADRVEIIGPDGRIAAINQAGLDVLGIVDPAEAIGTAWLSHWPASQHAAFTVALDAARAGQGGQIEGLEYGSHRRWWDVRLTRIRDASGPQAALCHVLAVARDITARHDEAERVALVLKAGAVIGIGLWEPGFLSLDDGLAAAFGMKPGVGWHDIAPLDFLARVHPNDHATLRALGRQARQSAGLARAAFRLRDGQSWRWVEALGLMVSGEQGQPLRLIGVLIDIDARTRAEMDLAQNDQTIRQIADQLPFLIAFIAPDQTCRFANRAYGDWFGQPDRGAAGRPVLRLFGEAIEDGPDALLHRALSGDPSRSDRQIRHRDGRLRDVEVRYLPRRGGDGEVDGCHVIGIDITSRKQQERALSRSNRSLEQSLALVQQESEQVWRLSRDLLAVFDDDGSLRSFNPAWQAVLGWSDDELRHHAFRAFLHPDDFERSLATTNILFETGNLSGFENRLRRKDGSYRWLSWNAVRADGLAYAAGRDVSDEKAAASRLQRTEEQLRHSQKMQAVGQLTGGIAHDFNNLLTGVIGSIEMMRNRVLQGRTSELGRYLDAASGAAERAAALTHRLLSFSRRQTLDPKPIEPGLLVAGMVKLLAAAAGPSAAVRIVRHPGAWTILCDPRQLEAALLNLANNARDAMPDGGVLVFEIANAVIDGREAVCETLVGDQTGEVLAGEYVEISATDTGIGMSATVAARAFDPFFTTKPIGRGSGLGLSMIYGFARQSGGQARILSVPGEGARVAILLPRHRGEKAAARSSGPRTGGAAAANPTAAG